MGWLELKVPPVPLAAVFAAAMYGVAKVMPAASFVFQGRIPIAPIVAILGGVISLAGVVTFLAKRTTMNPLTPNGASMVVTGGVYRISRNPMYLGLLLALAGLGLYLSNALALLFLPVFVVYMNRFQIKPEERILLAKFGPAFAQYMATVRRWI